MGEREKRKHVMKENESWGFTGERKKKVYYGEAFHRYSLTLIECA